MGHTAACGCVRLLLTTACSRQTIGRARHGTDHPLSALVERELNPAEAYDIARNHGLMRPRANTRGTV
ncbi:citrate (Pro-3S)-lyase, beta subunit [Anopheles sinensis]|uniref:Citrate (Pro-3S)-lyase, beta subunit n=1 Tax=Anopheles sinensis TaxID=74873 RepID=A0A084VB43_ANOSI|nr:citrate (Pro-3S)-lyase, beta subunit [Anopheles sinensis]